MNSIVLRNLQSTVKPFLREQNKNVNTQNQTTRI